MNADHDTIAAISTAPGPAGISIVRVSGRHSMGIADAIFRGPPPIPSQRTGGMFVHGYVHSHPHSIIHPVDPASPAPASPKIDIDEVILLIYRAPHSYTCEDVVEFQCHGGRTSAARILQAVLSAGATLAEPGEFTRRAFLNGRIDLLQAEAVADLIGAQSERAAQAAVEQLEGGLTTVFTSAYKMMIGIAADLEATIDFVEHELPEATLADIRGRLQGVTLSLQRLLATWHEGHLLREGALVVIAGQPNAGKSTLMNRLLQKNRSIVTDTPGTTRDTIEETMILDGFPVRLVDTAGLRESDCRIEREGVSRAMDILQKSDVAIYIVDASVELSAADREMLAKLDSCKTLVLLNKIDKGCRVFPSSIELHQGLPCSLTTGPDHAGCTPEIATIGSDIDSNMRFDDCLNQIRKALLARLGSIRGDIQAAGRLDIVADNCAVISARHKQIIQNALNFLNEATVLIDKDDDELLVPAMSCIRDAVHELGKATGQTYTDELLNEIFSRFCVGK